MIRNFLAVAGMVIFFQTSFAAQTHGYFFNQSNANDDVGSVNLSAIGTSPTFGSCPDAPFTSEICAIGSGAGLFLTAGAGTSLYAGTSTISVWYDAAPSDLSTRSPVLNDSGVGGGCTQAFDLSNGALPAGHMGWYYGYTLNCGSASQVYGQIDLGAVSSGVWHMYTLTNDGSNANVYIDGVLAAGFPNPSTGESASRQTNLLGDPNGAWARGAMRDVYVDGTAFTAVQVCALYAAQGGIGGSCGGGGTGTIQVSTNLSNSTFAITGPTRFTGSGLTSTFPNAFPGSYTINFGPVSGYSTPSPQMQTLSPGGTISFTGTYQTCTVDSAPVNTTYANNVIAGSTSGEGCQWTLMITNSQPFLWTNIAVTPSGAVITPAGDPASTAYSTLGILAPGQSINYSISFSQPDQSVEVLSSLTGGALDRAIFVNLIQGVINAASAIYPAIPVVELTIEDAGEIVQAANQMPDLLAALKDIFQTTCYDHLCWVTPNVSAGVSSLEAFFQNSTELRVFAELLASIGGDVLENALSALFKNKGFVIGLFQELYSNIYTAFLGSTTGAIFVTAQ